MLGLIKQMVAFADTDSGGIMYHGRYIELAERSRLQWLHDMNWPMSKIERETGVSLVVHKVKAEYYHPARLENILLVSSVLSKATEVRCEFSTEIYRDEKLIANIYVDIVSVKDSSIYRTPSFFLDIFKSKI
jgi:acyl-CoA thioester hydrolase